MGVCGSRSLEALVAFLGILKAGCAYVPLDEDHPPARLRAMAEDAGVHVAVILPGSTRRIRGLHTRIEIDPVADTAHAPARREFPAGTRPRPRPTAPM